MHFKELIGCKMSPAHRSEDNKLSISDLIMVAPALQPTLHSEILAKDHFKTTVHERLKKSQLSQVGSEG